MKIKAITPDRVDELPKPCRTCLYWEAPTEYQNDNGEEEAIEKKREWFKETREEFGNCGFLAYQNEKPIAYAQYGPATRFLNTSRYPATPSYDEDTVFLSCLFITQRNLRRNGIGTQVLKETLKRLKGRGYKSIETFARRGNPNNPSGPFEFYKENGFSVKKDDEEYPLMSLELDNV